jgi:hypothetical protein
VKAFYPLPERKKEESPLQEQDSYFLQRWYSSIEAKERKKERKVFLLLTPVCRDPEKVIILPISIFLL